MTTRKCNQNKNNYDNLWRRGIKSRSNVFFFDWQMSHMWKKPPSECSPSAIPKTIYLSWWSGKRGIIFHAKNEFCAADMLNLSQESIILKRKQIFVVQLTNNWHLRSSSFFRMLHLIVSFSWKRHGVWCNNCVVSKKKWCICCNWCMRV